jgi:hypothetical protein
VRKTSRPEVSPENPLLLLQARINVLKKESKVLLPERLVLQISTVSWTTLMMTGVGPFTLKTDLELTPLMSTPMLRIVT